MTPLEKGGASRGTPRDNGEAEELAPHYPRTKVHENDCSTIRPDKEKYKRPSVGGQGRDQLGTRGRHGMQARHCGLRAREEDAKNSLVGSDDYTPEEIPRMKTGKSVGNSQVSEKGRRPSTDRGGADNQR